ncbi:endonuclease/exonuclease/phosphatase family protein [Zeaxanthinibacter enoshimensis]|uniref:Peptidase A2 domain-containing protein n=1 Tax=Zeaxanthinibacter enoshimensis TaxID=392009 RepID=A0A4R6TVY2_9FLAO|nr:endonuclease/exonuclease/phosphatase family protein [Zeaxanthinibacter enoshimensis]TDQ33098.1 hypothetical protein CLV82_0936 [Zeaxanthinibacter enoshimensis]
MIYRLCLWILFSSFNSLYLIAQTVNTRTAVKGEQVLVAFYNVENLFDIARDSSILDMDRTPGGRDRWTMQRYQLKIERIATVISGIGGILNKKGPDIIGLCEVENYKVLNDLVSHPLLKELQYGIIHNDSPDERGIDVALLYNKDSFFPSSFKSRRLLLHDLEGERDYTRDLLIVGGWLKGEAVHFLVNHWPSRSGGKARSNENRVKAARLNVRMIDSLKRLHPGSGIIGMGDFNDNPDDDSLYKVLRAKARREAKSRNSLFNPMLDLYRQGGGTLAYRNRWSLFDQFYLGTEYLERDPGKWQFLTAGIYSTEELRTRHGPYRGYPFRTYAGGRYTGGYSDHFPVYLLLVKTE